jgi:branched-chain amino acid transport system ATP-binding protein
MSAEGDSTPDAPTDATGAPVLEADDLRVSYGQVTALRGLDLHVEEGEIVSLIGPNGAGKTTFANTTSGFLDYRGSVRFRGQEVSQIGQSALVEHGVIHCTEKRDLFGYMDVEDNLQLGAYRRGGDAVEERLRFVYDLFPRLEERKRQNARSMSGGEQQMLAIGRALMGDPDLLVLDEPTIGLAPVVLKDISAALDPILEQGVTILLTEQNVTFALKHADRIYLLENGEVVREGTPDELRGDDYIRESYLGG